MQDGFKAVVESGNTPGYWYALAYFLATLIFIHYNPKEKRKYPWILPLIPVGIVLDAFMTLTAGQSGVLFVVVMICIALTILFMVGISISGNLKLKLYYSIRAFMLGEFAGSFGWQVYYFFINQRRIHHVKAVEIITMLLTYAVIFGLSFLIEKRHQKGNADIEITGKGLAGIFLMSLLIYSFSNLSYVVTNTPFTTIYNSELFMIRTSADFMGVALLYMIHEILERTAEMIEAETIKNLLELQYNNYQVSEKNIELVNQKYHDLKHQIRLLQNNITEAEGSEYLSNMMSEIKQYEAQYKTGNRILDTVLSSESLKCLDQNIEINCVADGASLDFMQPMDISALFGNALDNAIEGTEKIGDPSQRLIYLSVNRKKGFVRIHVENPYVGTIQFKHHLPVTRKSDKNIHGYGMKSMKQIAEKYGGSIRAEASDNWFRLYILIPIP